MTAPHTSTTHAAEDGARIEIIRAEMHRLLGESGLGHLALGLASPDRELWQMGRAWIARQADAPLHGGGGGDVYLATQIYELGGHTALIGDTVRARRQAATGPQPHLILTNLHGQNAAPLSGIHTARTEIPASDTHILDDGTLAAKQNQLFQLLIELRPDRLFLFHHPDDPLPSVVAQPEIARQRILMHHADATPSFALHLPGLQLIDLNPVAAAISRVLGFHTALLPLTAPDPGPRPCGFLERGTLTTATSGSCPKFTAPHFITYAESVGVILQASQGHHVHIGPLDDTLAASIQKELTRREIAADRFIHVPETRSLARCLWEHSCDVYLSSFPIDGARANAEVLAAALPHLRHSRNPAADMTRWEIGIEGGMVWRTLEELAAIITGLAQRSMLEEKSRLARATYEKFHHPDVFAANLEKILAGQGGLPDPQQHERDLWALRSLSRSLITARAMQPDPRLDRQSIEIGALKQNCDRLKQQVAKLHQQRDSLRKKIERLQREHDRWLDGTSLRSRIRRWLLRK